MGLIWLWSGSQTISRLTPGTAQGSALPRRCTPRPCRASSPPPTPRHRGQRSRAFWHNIRRAPPGLTSSDPVLPQPIYASTLFRSQASLTSPLPNHAVAPPVTCASFRPCCDGTAKLKLQIKHNGRHLNTSGALA